MNAGHARLDAPRAGAAALIVAIATYAVLAFGVLSPDAMYVGDIGVKYVQARSLIANHFRRLDIPYRGEFLDPERRFIPLRTPFVMTSDGGLQAIFPPANAVIDGLFVALSDYRGMVLASVAAACVILWAAWRLAPAPGSAAVPLVLGLATPLWFYGVIGWEHAPAVAFSTLAVLVAVRSPRWPQAAAAGLLLGLAAALRDEALLLAPGLGVAVWLGRRRLPLVAAAYGGLAVALAAAGAAEVWWFHRPLAAHLLHAAHLLRAALHATATPNPEVPALQSMTLSDRYATVVQYWLLGYGVNWAIALFGGGFALALVARLSWQARWPLIVMLMAFTALSAWDVAAVVPAPKWVGGLYRLSPFLVFALIPSPASSGSSRLVRVTAALSFAAYVVLAFVGTDTNGGKSLGPRLLLPLLPLLAVAAWQGIVEHLRAPGRADRWIGRLGLSLTGLALALHLGGTIPAYALRSAEDGAVVGYLRQAAAPIVVADDQFTAQLLLPLYYRKIVLLADSQPLANALAAMLDRQRFASCVLVSREAEPRVAIPGFRRVATSSIGRMTVVEWRR